MATSSKPPASHISTPRSKERNLCNYQTRRGPCWHPRHTVLLEHWVSGRGCSWRASVFSTRLSHRRQTSCSHNRTKPLPSCDRPTDRIDCHANQTVMRPCRGDRHPHQSPNQSFQTLLYLGTCFGCHHQCPTQAENSILPLSYLLLNSLSLADLDCKCAVF